MKFLINTFFALLLVYSNCLSCAVNDNSLSTSQTTSTSENSNAVSEQQPPLHNFVTTPLSLSDLAIAADLVTNKFICEQCLFISYAR